MSWGRQKTQEKRENRERTRGLGAGSALGEGVSDFWRPVRDRKRALQEGGWGRSREVPGGHILPSAARPHN